MPARRDAASPTPANYHRLMRRIAGPCARGRLASPRCVANVATAAAVVPAVAARGGGGGERANTHFARPIQPIAVCSGAGSIVRVPMYKFPRMARPGEVATATATHAHTTTTPNNRASERTEADCRRRGRGADMTEIT